MLNADRRGPVLQLIEADLRRNPVTVGGLTPDMFRVFVTAFVRRSEEKPTLSRNARDLIREAESMAKWASVRSQDEILVRAFNPTSRSHGYDLGRTVIETNMVDQPFLLDTVRMFLREAELREYQCNHPILGTTRDDSGLVSGLVIEGEGRVNESWMHFEIEKVEDARLAEIEREVRERLTLSRSLVSDFKRQLRRLTAIKNELLLVATEQRGQAENVEGINAFLDWLAEDNFIFFGYGEFLPGADEPTSALGISRPEFASIGGARHLPSSAESWLANPVGLFFIGKGDQASRVHRSGRLDVLLVRRFGEDGAPAGFHMLTGLLTHKAVSEEGEAIPLLQGRLHELLAIEEVVEGSHQWKAIIAAFNSLPVEYLLSTDLASLRQAVHLIRSAEVSNEAQIYLRQDSGGRSAFALMTMPRDLYDEELRQVLSDKLVAALGATYHDDRQVFGEHDNVVASFYVTADRALKVVDLPALEQELLALTRTWSDKFAEALGKVVASDAFEATLRRFEGALPQAYQLITSPAEAAEDVLAVERLLSAGATQLRITRDGETGGAYKLKLYQSENIYLTDSLPVLANFGLRVIDQSNTRMDLGEGQVVFVDTFRVTPGEGATDLLARSADLEEGVRAVLAGRMENDLLNRLLLLSGLSWRQVDMLRAYVNCARQIEAHFPLEFTRRVWVTHHRAARLLSEFIAARFDPDGLPAGVSREDHVAAAHEAFNAYLRSVDNAAEDRILRTLGNLVESTLRTNFYMTPTRPWISFKLDSSKVTHMPSPRPYREIFVHHPKVEGMHLRGGPIARGGLRWSDRFDDYRTEVLGLMRTQMVKNVVIVPVGSKGGFVLKERYPTREEERARADELYKIFIKGLLDITDNLVGDAVKAPERVVRYDADDPYLVVAADKGTAHLSDTANSISLERGFWLGDAFASGGSQGYDHKKEAITAKGAWECVKRHFYEMGINPEKDVITVAGIGDLSGDVFGNGLLLSHSMKLQAAFNHMHIFFDPDPDPETSWQERYRMFNLPRSTWEDYNKDVISQGGGIYRRSAKAIPISPEMRPILGVDVDSLSGEEVVQAILKMKCDLLWNGGIGTYFKASTETHRDANDRVNDPVRVDAPQIGARVVAEGGNLGFTQAARVEFNKLGGRLNTDAVDNSAGVDMSDHEVNLKLLFGKLLASGQMTMEERNVLLRSLTAEVGELVLGDNFSQSRCISMDSIRARRDITRFGYLMDALEKGGWMKRDMERLPSDAVLAARAQAGDGMLRPELAVLLAFTKMQVYNFLLKDDRLKGGVVSRYLTQYFPKPVQEGFVDAIQEHPLRREILATALTTRIVDLAGMTFFQDMWEDTSFPVAETAMAYLITSELLGSDRLHNSLRELEGKVDMATLYRAHMDIEEAVASLVRRILRRGFDVFNPDAVIQRYSADFRQLHATLLEVVSPATQEEIRAVQSAFVAAGMSPALAQDVATFPHLTTSADIALLAEETRMDLPTSAWLYHAVGEEIRLRAAQALASPAGVKNRWEKTAIGVLRGKLIDSHYQIAHNVAARRGEQSVHDAFASYFEARKATVRRARDMEQRIKDTQAHGAAPLFVLAEVIGDLGR